MQNSKAGPSVRCATEGEAALTLTCFALMPIQNDQRVSHRLQALVARGPQHTQRVKSRPGMEDRTPGLQATGVHEQTQYAEHACQLGRAAG